ncbi:MAG: PRD domain-containing protein [Lachnospiraceae bacterium]
MVVEKIINNNVISSTRDGDELIVMGRGIGFAVKVGMEVDESKVEKVFKLENGTLTDKFKELIASIPVEHVRVADELITYANTMLNTTLNENIYLTLTDHISFAMKRNEENQHFYNAVYTEVKTFYRKEFMIGMYALELIEQRLGVRLPQDEAASIALHVVNAEFNYYMSDTMKSAKMIPELVKIVSDFFGAMPDSSNVYYERFIVHLKFLIYRILNKTSLNILEEEIILGITKQYQEEYKCSQEIAKYINHVYDYDTTEEELAYLTLHIRQVRMIRE